MNTSQELTQTSASWKQFLYNILNVDGLIEDHIKGIMFYQHLGIAENSTQDEIKSAYRKQALMYHPDKHTNSDDLTKETNEAKFKIISQAYEILSDENKKKACDQTLDTYRKIGCGVVILSVPVNCAFVGLKVYCLYKAASFGWYLTTSLISGVVGLII